jgi:beta-lactamase regulating signal transducer with metallopeptidase domain
MLAMIIEATARSLVLGLLVWLALTLTRSHNIHLQKMLWTAVLVVSLAMPLIMRVNVFIPAALLVRGLFTSGPLNHAQAAHAANPTVLGATALYFLVAAALLASFARNLLRMNGILRNARAFKECGVDTALRDFPGRDIRVTNQLSTPATFGSTILLPTSCNTWSPQTLHAVLAHEHSHVRHHDSYLLWLARLYTCLFWINPLGWLIQRRLAALSEMTSDEAAVATLGDGPSYAEILLTFAHLRATHPTSGVAMAQSNISSRIDRILSNIVPSTRPKLSLRIVALAALLPLVAATAAPLDVSPPTIKQAYDLATLMKYYPPAALHRGIEGLVHLQVSLDSTGHATDTLILSEQPQDLGFGAAASSLAHLLEYDNPSHRPTQLTFNVKFALPPQPAPSGTTQFTAPEAP